MAKITIVDKEDNVIGEKDRSEITPPDIYRVSALWLTNSRDDILLAQRSFNKKNQPGKWGPAVAGTVEADEDYDKNIVKEIEEEIGLKVSIKDLTKGPKLFRNGELHKYFGQWYLYAIDKPAPEFRIKHDEVEKVKWFSKNDLEEAFNAHPDDFLSSAPEWLKLFCK